MKRAQRSPPPLTHIAVPQVRVDCTGYVGYSPNPSFDPLIAKIIAHAADWRDAVQVLRRALAEVHIAGVSSNVGFLQALAATREFEANDVTTTFIEENMLRLCDPQAPGVQSDLRAPAGVESIELPAHQQQQQQQIPSGSIPLISPIRGRVSRLAAPVQGQLAAGANACVS
jgi:acetyl/propionyl-CoA carboxylase alpha subunit